MEMSDFTWQHQKYNRPKIGVVTYVLMVPTVYIEYENKEEGQSLCIKTNKKKTFKSLIYSQWNYFYGNLPSEYKKFKVLKCIYAAKSWDKKRFRT